MRNGYNPLIVFETATTVKFVIISTLHSLAQSRSCGTGIARLGTKYPVISPRSFHANFICWDGLRLQGGIKLRSVNVSTANEETVFNVP